MTDKKNFFGDHLEIKPIFMQRPKSMEEVMAEAFSHPSSTAENNASVEHKPIVENNATVENSSVEHKPIVENNATVENLHVESNAIVESSAIPANSATVAEMNKTSQSPIEQKDKANESSNIVAEPTTNTLESTAIVAISSAVENSAIVAVKATVVIEVPSRLRTDVELLRRMVTVKWQTFPEIEKAAVDSPSYWQAYTKAWHWIEDEEVPYLDKDSKLTLRKCYRKAFGDISAKGRFFGGQTILAQEVGLSKRRIQDILEIFNLLGWVRKIAHHNRGGYKGTDYEMYLPPKAIEYFLESML